MEYLDIFLIVSTVFVIVIWTVLTLVLIRVYKILWTVVELVWYYNKVKQILSIYSHIPTIIKDKVFSFFWKSK